VWPHLTIIAIICAVAAGVGVAWWMKREPAASAKEVPNAARIQRVEGDVALSNAQDNSNANAGSDQWIAATENQPFSVADRIYTRDNSRASVAFTGRNFALGQTAADVVLSQIDGRDAGYLVDDYYAYQYPQYYDGRYRDYNTYVNDPYWCTAESGKTGAWRWSRSGKTSGRTD
jgi:hypothetical protein